MEFAEMIDQVFDDKLVFKNVEPQWEIDEEGYPKWDDKKKKIPILDKNKKQVEKVEMYYFNHFTKGTWNEIAVFDRIPQMTLAYNPDMLKRVGKVFDEIFVKIEVDDEELDFIIEHDTFTKLKYIKYFNQAFRHKLKNIKKK